MAAISAQVGEDFFAGYITVPISGDFFPFISHVYEPSVSADWYDSDTPGAVRETYRMASRAAWQINATELPSYFEDFYFRIHRYPNPLELGFIASTQEIPYTIWNSWLTPRTLTAINGESPGFTLSGQPDPPLLFNPLQLREWTLTVTTEGEFSIDSELEFVFDSETVGTPTTGLRIIAVPFAHNWSQRFVESESWLTDVIRSYNGSEQRAGLRLNPRIEMQTRHTSLEITKTQKIINLLYGNAPRTFGPPLWSDMTRLETPLTIGDVVITCDTEGRRFAPGSAFIIIDRDENYETGIILSVTAMTITAEQGLLKSWAIGAKICPLIPSYLVGNVGVSYSSDETAELAINWIGRPQDQTHVDYSSQVYDEYDGVEVLLIKPDRAVNVTLDFDSDAIGIDNSQGVFNKQDKKPRADLVINKTWTLDNRTDVYAMKGFFSRRRGRLKSFYMPTHNADFVVLNSAVGSAQITLDVLDTGYRTYASARTGVIMYTTAGELMRDVISSEMIDETTIRLTFDAPFGFDLANTDFLKMCYLDLYRLNSDKITYSWTTTGVCRISVDFMEIQA